MAKVTYKEMADIMKTFLISLLAIVPIIIIINIAIANLIPNFVLIIIDCIILVGGSVLGYIIVDRYKQRIKQKREEYQSEHQNEE
ncbi:MAG: hypothetical protein IKQ31_03990 [Clostridia bacterium]|nr:hypothetical protein [Clostridia bacterium]